MSRDFFSISGSSRLPWSHFRFDDVISGPVTSFPVLASIPCSAELSVPVPPKQPPGQAGHVGQIRLSDWLKFEMLASDWSVCKPTPYTTPVFPRFTLYLARPECFLHAIIIVFLSIHMYLYD